MIKNKFDNLKNIALYFIIFVLFSLFLLDINVLHLYFSTKVIIVSMIYLIIWVISKNFIYHLSDINLITKMTLLLLAIIGAGFFINGVIFNVRGYICYGVIYAFMIPLFLIFDIDKKAIINAFINIAILFNVLTIILSFTLEPINSKEQYSSIYRNPNLFGIFLSVFIIAVMIKLLQESKLRYTFLIATDIAFILLSESRTTMLTLIILLILFCTYHIKIKRVLIRKAIFKLISTVLLTIIIWNISVFVLANLTPTVAETLVNKTVHNTWDTHRTKHLLNKIEKGLDNDGRFTSGRKEIWGKFSSNVKFLGHKNETIVFSTNKDGKLERDAHNSVLQLSYTSGIISGLCLLIIFLVGTIQGIRFLISLERHDDKNKEYNLFITMIFFAYLVNSSLTAMYNLQHSLLSFAFWMIGINVMNFKTRKRI